jgi:hypothetical protein
MRYLPLMLLLACGPTGWQVTGGTPAQQDDARWILERVIALQLALPDSGYIAIMPPGSLDGTCGTPPGTHVAGCNYVNGVEVTAPPDYHMVATALAHELCHYSVGYDEAAANACADKVNGASP